MSETLLRVSGLKTYFYTASGVAKAVDGVSFSLNRGEVMGIVGESGSGKSVTSNSIIRLLPPQTGRIVAGEILFEDRDILKMSNKELLEFRGKEIATIFQDPMTSLDPVFKIGKQMVEMICAHQKVSKAEARKMAVDALNRVGIPEPEKRMESYPYELSGGMCQRVIIAMAVCCKPKFILADEPTTALDVTVQAQVLDLLKDLQKEMNTSILLITHNLVGNVRQGNGDVRGQHGGERRHQNLIFESPASVYMGIAGFHSPLVGQGEGRFAHHSRHTAGSAPDGAMLQFLQPLPLYDGRMPEIRAASGGSGTGPFCGLPSSKWRKEISERGGRHKP